VGKFVRLLNINRLFVLNDTFYNGIVVYLSADMFEPNVMVRLTETIHVRAISSGNTSCSLCVMCAINR